MTASGDQTIRMWDVNRDQCLAVFKGHSCSVKSVDFREDEICEYHGLMSVFFMLVVNKFIIQKDFYSGAFSRDF